MAVTILLDTDAFSAFMRGHEGVVARVRQAERVLLSAIVAGELLFGFRRGSRYGRNLKTLEAFLANPFVELLPVTWTTAERFGRIASALRAKGRPIPTNDIWIAALTIQHDLVLFTRDRHFDTVPRLARI